MFALCLVAGDSADNSASDSSCSDAGAVVVSPSLPSSSSSCSSSSSSSSSDSSSSSCSPSTILPPGMSFPKPPRVSTRHLEFMMVLAFMEAAYDCSSCDRFTSGECRPSLIAWTTFTRVRLFLKFLRLRLTVGRTVSPSFWYRFIETLLRVQARWVFTEPLLCAFFSMKRPHASILFAETIRMVSSP